MPVCIVGFVTSVLVCSWLMADACAVCVCAGAVPASSQAGVLLSAV